MMVGMMVVQVMAMMGSTEAHILLAHILTNSLIRDGDFRVKSRSHRLLVILYCEATLYSNHSRQDVRKSGIGELCLHRLSMGTSISDSCSQYMPRISNLATSSSFSR